MWEKEYGPVPYGKVVHHKDGNKENDVMENFELRDRDEHTAMHQFFDSVDELAEE